MGSWWLTGEESERGWRLDIVSLLAVIGESSMADHSQAMTSSWTCLLPRLVPAPQVLLKAIRPGRLPQVPATVVGVHSGMKLQTLNYFPNIIHPLEELEPFAFKVFEIKHRKSKVLTPELTTENKLEGNGQSVTRSVELESGHAKPRRRWLHSNTLTLPQDPKEARPHVPSRRSSPLNVLSVGSSALTMGLLIWAILIQDGVACIALATISLASSIVGYASWWSPMLMKRTGKAKVPDGDIVVRTREGAFIVIKCDEDVARELYTGTESCQYKVKIDIYRMLVGIGTFLLMVAVVLMGNCGFTMQCAIGASYIVLNFLFWMAAIVNKLRFWNLSAYEYEPEGITPAFPDAIHAHEEHIDGKEANFTRTMWYAIFETRKTGWVIKSDAAPSTKPWQKWLAEAKIEARKGNKDWNAVGRKNELVGVTDSLDQALAAASSPVDTAEQHAPSAEVAS